MNIARDIHEYIQDLQSRQYPREQIEQILKSEGYHHGSIKKAFKELETASKVNVEHQLYEYILGMLQQGYQLTAIHEQLQGQGYDAKTLNKVFAAIGTHQDPAATQTTQHHHKPNGMTVAILFALVLIGALITIFSLIDIDSSDAFEETTIPTSLSRDSPIQIVEDAVPESDTNFESERVGQVAVRSTLPIPEAAGGSGTTTTNSGTQQLSGGNTQTTPIVEITEPITNVETGTLEEYCRNEDDDIACITAFAFAKGDNSLCTLQPEISDRDSCYEQFILNGNRDLCDVVVTESVQSTCALLA